MLLSIEINADALPAWEAVHGTAARPVVMIRQCGGRDIVLYTRLRTRRGTCVGVAVLLGVSAVIALIGFAVAVNLDAGDTKTALLGAALIGALANVACRRVLQMLRPLVWLDVPASVAPHLGLVERGGGA